MPTDQLSFSAFGVRVGIRTWDPQITVRVAERLGALFPDGVETIPDELADHVYDIRQPERGYYEAFKGPDRLTYGGSLPLLLNYLDSMVRMNVAEHAVGRVFMHAGAVAWKGRAIVMPANSFQGKTTLVKELARLGAVYYSDEYAVLDEDARLHPFPKKLSVRGILDEHRQVDVSVESLGGATGTKPVPVGVVLLSEYRKGARWNPVRVPPGLGVLEMLPHTIPARRDPEFALRILTDIAGHATIFQTKRGDAARTAPKILELLD